MCKGHTRSLNGSTMVSVEAVDELIYLYFVNISHLKPASSIQSGVNNSVTRWIIDTFFAGDWFRVSLFDMTPVDVTFPDVDQVIGSIGSFQSIEVMWSKVVPDVNSFHVNLGSTSESIKARFTAFIRGMQEAYSASVRLVPSMVPDDYDPPIYVGTSDLISNPDEEVTLFRDKSDVSTCQFLCELNFI